MICPSSRTAALAALDEFIPIAALYARDRNQVKPGHPSVSRLSSAIRHRLITEQEVVAAVLRVYPFSRVEKFIQEVNWRRYWKSWLGMRPDVWTEYRVVWRNMDQNPAAMRIEESRSGNQVIDYFSNELVTTGYLHNHARMWFAAWWVHEARLPWQAGAAFFFRHLLDGDPASNTLSWRWVAGLQTPSKTYLARRSNLEKHLAPELLQRFTHSLDDFEGPQAIHLETTHWPPLTRKDLPSDPLIHSVVTGLWIHEEDLAPETSLIGTMPFSSVLVSADLESWNVSQFPSMKRKWISAALEDAAIRAGLHWNTRPAFEIETHHVESMVRWAREKNIEQIVALRPDVGPLNDTLPSIRAHLAVEGVRLVLVDRPEDLQVRPFATRGFFPFWERLRKSYITNLDENNPAGKQLEMKFSQ